VFMLVLLWLMRSLSRFILLRIPIVGDCPGRHCCFAVSVEDS